MLCFLLTLKPLVIMKSFTHLVCYKQIKNFATSAALIVLFSATANAQFQQRNYSVSYSADIQGSTTMFGNTIEAIYKSDNVTVDTAQMNSTRANGNSSSGNNGSNMRYIDIDGNTGSGVNTYNSSSADLSLPAGTNIILFARLYWGGRTTKAFHDMTLAANQKILIEKGVSGGYTQYTADHIDDTLSGTGKSGSPYTYDYQAYTDITSLIQSGGAGTYTVANIPASQGVDSISGGSGYYGGWCIVIAYQNTTAFTSYNSIRIYDGYREVYSGGNATLTTVTLNSLNVPSGTLSLRDATMGVMAWEGDAQLTGDSLRINDNYFSNAVNPINNVFNGSISDTGVFVNAKNPNYTDQMALDIDQFYVGTGFNINPNDQSVTLAFTTSGDGYFPGVFTFVIKTKSPNPILNKSVVDSNGDHIAEAGELLTYTLTGQNTGAGNANLTVISDTLPNTVTYVPGSLKVIYSPGVTAGSLTDASGDDVGEYISNGTIHTIQFQVGTGATATAGGTLADNDSFHYQFQVRVNTPASGTVPPIVNVAEVIAYSDANVESIDFGTAIIDPQGGPLPVSLTSFTVSVDQNEAKVNWATSMENNCKEYFVERSTDGTTFSTVAIVAGHGTTTQQNLYSVTDDITTINSSIVYYRLAQVDADGKINYSRVVAVKLQVSDGGFSVFPNPFNSFVTLNFQSNNNETAIVKVFNMQGSNIVLKSIQLTKGINYISIDELSALPSGNYLVQLISSDGSIAKMVTKQ